MLEKPFNESVLSKAVASTGNHQIDQVGQVNGQLENSSYPENKHELECGCGLSWS